MGRQERNKESLDLEDGKTKGDYCCCCQGDTLGFTNGDWNNQGDVHKLVLESSIRSAYSSARCEHPPGVLGEEARLTMSGKEGGDKRHLVLCQKTNYEFYKNESGVITAASGHLDEWT